MKKAVILTGKAGFGHLAVAGAYQFWLQKWGYNAQVYDVLPALSDKLTTLLYKVPKTYKSLFKMSNTPSMAKMMLETSSLDIEKRIKKKAGDLSSADLVISTHPLIHPQSGKSKIMLLIDPNIHAIYFSLPRPDAFFAFWEQSLAEADRFGIDLKRVFYTGPLARSSFYEIGKKTLKNNFKGKIRKKMCLPEDKKIVLVMAGSGWIHRAEKYLKPLRESFKKEKITFVFLCGRNQDFLKDVAPGFRNEKLFKFLKWINEEEVAQWMAAADCGLAFSLAQMSVEAGLVGLPLFIFRLIEGQEEGYREVIDDKGAGMYIPGEPENQVEILKVLLKHGEDLFDKSLFLWQKELLSTPEKVKIFLSKITS